MNLHAAIEAARAESADDAAGPSATRRSVLAAIERSPRRRLHLVVAAVIASMFGASAFAYYARTPRPARPAPTVATAPSTMPAPDTRAIGPRVERIAAAPPPIAPPIDPPIDPPIAPPIDPPRVTPARVVPPRVTSATPAVEAREAEPATPVVGAAPAPQRDPELAMYSEAHQLHFRDRNMAAAVDAWNRYLAAAPDGKLAPEARFNRVVALVKLERWSEAARALEELGDSTFRAAELARLRAVVSSHLAR